MTDLVRVGDPSPICGSPRCYHVWGFPYGMHCTQPHGHDGQHVASDGRIVVAIVPLSVVPDTEEE